MLKVYTRKKYLYGKEIIYDAEKYFNDVVCRAIKQGDFNLNREAQSIIISENGVTGLKDNSVITEYGIVGLQELSADTKLMLIMNYMFYMSCSAVLNVNNYTSDLHKILKTADKYDVAVFISLLRDLCVFENINLYAVVNENETVKLCDHTENVTEVAYMCKSNITSGIHLAAHTENVDIDFISDGYDIVIKTKSELQKNTVLKALKQAVAEGSLRITGTDSDTFEDVSLNSENIIFIDKNTNVYDVSDRLVPYTRMPYVLVFDRDKKPSMSTLCYELSEKNIVLISFTVDDCSRGLYTLEEEKSYSYDDTLKFRFSLSEQNNPEIHFSDLELC